MVFLNKLKTAAGRAKLSALKKADPTSLLRASEQGALRSFKTCYAAFAPYQELCRQRNVNPQQINSIETFRRHVPITDKATLYNAKRAGGEIGFSGLDKAESILLSSGAGGSFSFGYSTAEEARSSAQMLEVILDDYYDISRKKTLLINCLAQAVKMPSIGVCIAEIGPRADSLCYLLKTLTGHFAQTVVIGDPFFIKNALEEAQENGCDLKAHRIHLIMGGMYFPESLRSYLASLLNIDFRDKATGTIYSSMGISEFGLNLFFESEETVRLRRLCQDNPALRQKILGDRFPYLPMFFNYLPQMLYVEEAEGALLLTSLKARPLLPLIRYETGDYGRLVDYHALKDLLGEFTKQGCLPRFGSPLALVLGKAEALTCHGKAIYPQLLQEALYREESLARAITGNFRLGLEQGKPVVKIQLNARRGDSRIAPTEQFQKTVSTLTNTEITAHLIAYQDFPHGMALDYERKIKFI